MKPMTLSHFVQAWEASARIATQMLQAMQLSARGQMSPANMMATLSQIEADHKKIGDFLAFMKTSRHMDRQPAEEPRVYVFNGNTLDGAPSWLLASDPAWRPDMTAISVRAAKNSNLRTYALPGEALVLDDQGAIHSIAADVLAVLRRESS